MKVLAKRANGWIFVAPVIFMALLMYMVSYFNTIYNPERPLETILLVIISYRFIFSFVAFIYCLSSWVLRVLTPKIIIEYDNAGIYVYRFKHTEPFILRYENLYSVFSEEDMSQIYVRRNRFAPWTRISNPTWGISKTGNLRIELPDHFITLHGVENVSAVRYELVKLIKESREKQDEWLDYNIERVKREKELEELAKHDINT